MNFDVLQFKCIKKNNVISLCMIANLFIGQLLIASYEPSAEVLDVIETISKRMTHATIPFDNQGIVAFLKDTKDSLASYQGSSLYKNLPQHEKAKIDERALQKDLDFDFMISVINQNQHIQFKQHIQEYRARKVLKDFCKDGSNSPLGKTQLYWGALIDFNNKSIQECIRQCLEPQDGLCNLK